MKDIIVTTAKALGFTPKQLKKWRHRGAVPHKHRLPLIEAARASRKRILSGDMEWSRHVASQGRVK